LATGTFRTTTPEPPAIVLAVRFCVEQHHIPPPPPLPVLARPEVGMIQVLPLKYAPLPPPPIPPKGAVEY